MFFRRQTVTAACVLGLARIVAGQNSLPFTQTVVPFTERPVRAQGAAFRAALDAEPDLVKAAEMLFTAAATKCGDSTFYVYKQCCGFGAAAATRVYEMKAPFAAHVLMQVLNRADKLNGIQASGEYTLVPEVLRFINEREDGSATSKWTEWQGLTQGFGTLTLMSKPKISLDRKSGHWKVNGEWVYTFTDQALSDKMTCAAATTPNPFDWVRKEKAAAAAEAAAAVADAG